MPFLNERFPDDISRGAIGGAGFLTDVVMVESGHEFRRQARALELGSWEVSHAARLPEKYRRLQAFFRVAAGRANGFRFKDWTDFEAAQTEGVFVLLTGSTGGSTWQMYKRYTFGAYTYDRKIQKPINGTVTVTGGSGHSIDYATGILTEGLGEPTSWAGEFDVPARFDTDVMRAETIEKQVSGELVVGWSSIPIVEIRL
jgi:uncharacterized protein (TIGR02217 family)